MCANFGVPLLLALICSTARSQVAATEPAVRQPLLLAGTTPQERAAEVVRAVSTMTAAGGNEKVPKGSAANFAARILLGVDTDDALNGLHQAASHVVDQWRQDVAKGSPPALDPFDKEALVAAYFVCKGKIPKETADTIREYVSLYTHKEWQGYDAMNYRLMNDGAGYLAAEEWPDLVDRDKLSAEQIKQATTKRLFEYFDGISRRNYAEYGATIYGGVNLASTRLIAEFARDPEMRKRAIFALHAMLLDIACVWNQGYQVGTASRAKYWYSTNGSPDSMPTATAIAWIYFGAFRPVSDTGGNWAFWMAYPGQYKLPQDIIDVAQSRTTPFVQRSYLPALRSNVHRSTYHTPTYSLASQFDQCPSPTDSLYKESRRNMLKWLSDKPSSTFAVCMDNPARPYRLNENRANKLGYGENPFSQYMQDESTLLGLYSVPDDYPNYKLYAPFSVSGAIVKRVEKAGWIFCHNGSMLMAFRSIAPGTWGKGVDRDDVYWVDARRNGWILETAQLKPYAGGGADAELDRFAAAVIDKTHVDSTGVDQAQPVLKYTSFNGRQLEFTWLPHKKPYVAQQKIDGQPIDYFHWPQIDNPWVKQERNSPVVAIRIRGRETVYDFEKLTRTDRPLAP